MENNTNNINPEKKQLDVHATTSELTGWMGLLESFVRKFKNVGFAVLLAPIVLLYIVCVGISLTPGILLIQGIYFITKNSNIVLKSFSFGAGIGCAFFLYGFTLIFIVPLFNKLLFLKVRPQRTTWFSVSVIPWYYHNALTYLARYTFLDIITPTPFNLLFYKMMGMKIGKGTMINTSNISDPALIELGDYVTIGGSATLVAHYGMKGFLIIDKLVIKDGATIGLKASLFGDVEIGKNVTVKAHEVVMPKTKIPDFVKSEKN